LGTYGVWGSTWAAPEITSLYLTLAATVGLRDDSTTVAGRYDKTAVLTGLKTACLYVEVLRWAGHGHGDGGQDGNDWDGEELHVERFEGRLK